DVGRGVGADAGEFQEPVPDGIVRSGGILEPFGLDLARGEEASELDDSLVAVADAAAGAEGGGPGAGESFRGGEGVAQRAGAVAGWLAGHFAEATVHDDSAGPGDVATGD